MSILTVDYETYYDQDYSLSKMTTEEYIRDPRFEIIGVSVAKDAAKPEWFSGTLRDTTSWLGQFEWDRSLGVAHNAMFDMAILNWVNDIRPRKIGDTLSMARAIHTGDNISLSLANLADYYDLGQKGGYVADAKGIRRKDFTPEQLIDYGDYCIQDGSLTYNLFKALIEGKRGPAFPIPELDLIDITIRMFSEPRLELDSAVLEEHLADVIAQKAKLMDAVSADPKAIRSNEQFAGLLRKLKVEPPMKISPTTGKETYAFAKSDEEFTDLKDHPNPKVQALVAARLGAKSTIEETRTKRFLDISHRGKLPVPLLYYGAHTGRWSGSEKTNLQNLKRGSKIKKAMRAPEGYLVCNSDSSQIEARTSAWLAGCKTMMDLFAQNDAEIAAGVPKADMEFDPYKVMAAQVYRKPVLDIDVKTERHVGKVGVLAAMYGIGPAKLMTYARAQGIDMGAELAQIVVDTYRSEYHEIPALWKVGGEIIKSMIGSGSGVVEFGAPDGVLRADLDQCQILLPNGLALRYPELHYDEGEQSFKYNLKRGRSTMSKYLWGGSLKENYTQALARIIIGEQMVRVAKRYPILLTVHDAQLPLIPIEEKDEGFAFVEHEMRRRPAWAHDLPLNCESHIGETYG
tara:strand:- start:16071 stop:17954 length:1884 start_codon:yes stop_codon:yes gene_type:complete